jgi:hypothetical protein
MNHTSKSLVFLPTLLLLPVLLAASGWGKKSAAPASEASMEDLNRALAVVMMHAGQRLPSSNEVATFLQQTGKVFPSAPAGKTIILNPTTRKFEVVDQ